MASITPESLRVSASDSADNVYTLSEEEMTTSQQSAFLQNQDSVQFLQVGFSSLMITSFVCA